MNPVNSHTLPVGTNSSSDPVWRIALLYPPQGSWTEHDYLALDAGRLIEFDAGKVEVHDLPTLAHQRIVQTIYRAIFLFLNASANPTTGTTRAIAPTSIGEVFVAPLPVRLWQDKFREPDVVFIANDRSRYRDYPDGADLVVEVVSDDPASRRRDIVDKVTEYATAKIDEYWIVDPQAQEVHVGQLTANSAAADMGYEFTIYKSGETLHSKRLSGLVISVSDIFKSP